MQNERGYWLASQQVLRYQRCCLVGRDVLVPRAFGVDKYHWAMWALVSALGAHRMQVRFSSCRYDGRSQLSGSIARAFLQAGVAIADEGSTLNKGKVFCHE